ncbi:MAG: branched-chain amino acid ABC transporter permease [Candidatus Geothermarchaeales archaeon]
MPSTPQLIIGGLDIIPQLIANGIVMGSIYALMGAGLALIFGVSEIVNVAHGDFLMVGAYVTYAFISILYMDPLTAIVVAMLVSFLLGGLVEKSLVSTVRRKSPSTYIFMTNTIILTLGVGIFLQNIMLWIAGPFYRMTPPLLDQVFEFYGAIIFAQRLLALGIALAVIGLLFLFLRRTKLGKAIRATAQDADAAEIMGINIHRIRMINFGLGVGLASVAGSLIAPIFFIFPMMGWIPTIKAFVVIIMGGMTVEGAIFSGFILGLAESFGGQFISTEYKAAIGLIIMLLVLVFKPEGLFGKRIL